MRTDGPSIHYQSRPELAPDGRITMWLDRFILVADEGQKWILAGSTITDQLTVDEALELMLQLGGVVTQGMAAQRERLARGERVEAVTEPQAAPAAPAGVNQRMHLYGPEDGPTVTLTLPRQIAENICEGLHRYVPAFVGASGPVVDEIRYQLADQRPVRPVS